MLQDIWLLMAQVTLVEAALQVSRIVFSTPHACCTSMHEEQQQASAWRHPVMHRSCDAPFCLCRSFTAGHSPGCCCARLKITGAAGSRTIVQHYDSVYEKVQHLLTATVTGCSADLIVSALAAAGISRGDMLRLNDPRRPPQQAGAFTMLLSAPQETCKLLLTWQAAKQCSHNAVLCHHTAWSLKLRSCSAGQA